jgi:hypothetical protein
MEILKQIQTDTYIRLRNMNIRKKTKNQQNECNVINNVLINLNQEKLAEYVKKSFLQVQITSFLIFFKSTLYFY